MGGEILGTETRTVVLLVALPRSGGVGERIKESLGENFIRTVAIYKVCNKFA